MLIQWGVDLADEHGVEAYTEAHEGSRALYDKFCFRSVVELEVDTETDGRGSVRRCFVSLYFFVRYKVETNWLLIDLVHA